MSLTKTVVTVLGLFGFYEAAFGAEVVRGKAPWDKPTIHISGAIKHGDAAKVQELAKGLLKDGHEIQISLDSEGGDFLEAIKIGEFVKSLNARTIIQGLSTKDSTEPMKKCLSACFIIFVSGSVRHYINDNELFDKSGNRILREIPVLGIHRPFVAPAEFAKLSPEEARQVYASIEKATRGYLSAINVPASIVDTMFGVSSKDVKLISKKDFSDRIGYYQSHFEEWEISVCDGFGPQEINDLAKIKSEQILTGRAPSNISAGYVQYLVSKEKKIEDCKDKAIFKFQKSVLKTN